MTHNFAAVTGACLDDAGATCSEKAGGFDEAIRPGVQRRGPVPADSGAGYRVLWTPEAELYHLESKTRGYEDTPEKLARFRREFVLFLAKWGEFLKAGDPYYNRNFRLDRADYALRA